MKASAHFSSYVAELFLEREIFQTAGRWKHQNTHFMFHNFFFFFENSAVYEVMWKNI